MSDRLHARLWTYQGERFPLLKTAALTLAFSSSSVTASATMAGRAPPDFQTYATAFLTAFVVMLELRVLDEFKDAEIDRLFRPERPVPRGLVTLREVAWVGIVGAVLTVAALAFLSPRLLLPLAGTVAFMAAMTVHFGVPGLMHRSLLLTLLSHMLVMPAMDYLVTATEWLTRAGSPPAALWIFLALSFANGCVLELGRKTWASENELPNVESYSSAWGLRPAMAAWFAFLVAAFLLICALAVVQGGWLGVPMAAVVLGWVATEGVRFLRLPVPAAQARLDTASGVWILASYLIAGYAVFLSKWIVP